MNLPFTVEQFLDVFRQYNADIWPMQVLAYLLGIAAVALAVKKTRFSDTADSLILAFFWLWMGIVYHWMHFAEINKAAWVFGGLFVLQGVFLIVSGAVKRSLSFNASPNLYAITGSVFIAYAMIIYPLLSSLFGHGYPRSPCFGVAPCPATIFTFGLLLMTDRRVPGYLLVIPLLWSFIGFTAALKLGVREDTGLLIAGVLGTALLVYRNRTLPRKL